jgi:hypothetical protein
MLFCYWTCLKLKLSVWLIKHQATKTYGGMEVQLQTIITLSLNAGDLSTLHTGRSISTLDTRAPQPVWKRYRTERNLLEIELQLFGRSSLKPSHYTDWTIPAPSFHWKSVIQSIRGVRAEVSAGKTTSICIREDERDSKYAELWSRKCCKKNTLNVNKEYMVKMGDGCNWLRTVASHGL